MFQNDVEDVDTTEIITTTTSPTNTSNSNHSTLSSSQEEEEEVLLSTGILSTMPFEFFQTIRNKIDYHTKQSKERCQRYGWTYNNTTTTSQTNTTKRKIYFGSLIANETMGSYFI